MYCYANTESFHKSISHPSVIGTQRHHIMLEIGSRRGIKEAYQHPEGIANPA